MGKNRGRWGAFVAAPVLVLSGLVAAAAPAVADTTSRWAEWADLTGTGGNYQTTVQIADSPALTAQVRSDSRAGQVGVISGASTWLSAGTEVGQKYGDSRDQQYLNLRPKVDTPSGASTTTYTFSKPTPTANWTFVLGDIDADLVKIRAIGPNGVALNATQLGFNGGFNYCAPGLPGKPSCTGDATDVPNWDPSTLTLTGNDAAVDTSGSAAWFEPSAPISSLTFTFQRRTGFPVYQTWFASLSRDVSGTVTDAGGDGSGVVVTLTDANGTEVGTAITGIGGTYEFPGVQASDGYIVRAKAPAGKIIEGATGRSVDLSDTDAVEDFSMRDIVPVAVTGVVQDTDGNPIPGATVTLDNGAGSVVTATTGADGTYLFDSVGTGTWTPAVTLPDGFVNPSTQPPFTIDGSSEDPIENVNFTGERVKYQTISGSVSTPGGPAAGVTVTATGPDGTLTAVTDADGRYVFPRLLPGEYTITAEGDDTSQTVDIVDSNVTDIDFEIVKVGAVRGTVTAGGEPVPQVMLGLSGDLSFRTSSGEDGSFTFGDIPPGTYEMTIEVPEGYTLDGPAIRTVVIDGSGALVADQDFVLVAVAASDAQADASGGSAANASAQANAAPDATAGGSADAGAGSSEAQASAGAQGDRPGVGGRDLANTGTDFAPMLGTGGVLLAIGAVVLLVARRRKGTPSA
ncbi:carboxypeptidase-like regulatory domain-containing protein [Leucobacter japonicus]|uniref:carboxypeptidase-like regulatory domain-containing protein n=1 Tax=Leucobacter japonicus TaxID=1461259 RepID=UPI0009E26174|nr:carboxypeptidase-like regulatory domain-containing protein [Leucobacter japonicus]